MSVHKKKSTGKHVSWGYEFSIGSRGAKKVYKANGFETRDAALKAEAARRLELDYAEAIQAKGTLGEAIQKFFADRGPSLSPKTLERYRQLAEMLHPDLRALPITAVRALGLHEEWGRLLKEGGKKHGPGIKNQKYPLSQKTVRNIAGVVSSACAWAVLYDLITVNPVTASKPPSAKGKAGIALAPSQVQLAVDAANGWLADFLDVEAGLGIRRGEALALRWADIADGYVTVTRSLGQVRNEAAIPAGANVEPIGGGLYFKSTKTDEPRRFDIPASTMAALGRHRLEQNTFRAAVPDYNTAADLVFCDPGGDPLRPDQVSKQVSRLMRRCKLPKGASLHTLRHTHGSQLIEDGASPAAVAKRLGHSTAATTLGIYSHAVPGREDLAAAWEKLQDKNGKAN